jgi:hypothetical protein
MGNSLSDSVDLLIPFIGKFDGSGVSGSTGRGRSQALESKVRFADHSGVSQNTVTSKNRNGVNPARRGLSVGWSRRGHLDRAGLLLSRTPELARR